MTKRKLIFNIYEDLPLSKEKKPIKNEHLAIVMKELPITGAVRWTLADGSKLMTAKHDYVKNETYDVYWTEQL